MEAPTIPAINTKGCVFKLSWGQRYVIVKCKFYPRAKTIIDRSLYYHLKHTKMKDLLYGAFFDYIEENPGHTFQVEMIYEGDNPYFLLKHEQMALDKAKHDVNCMNVRFEAYYPKNIQGKDKFWINRGHFLNFKQWYKRTHSD